MYNQFMVYRTGDDVPTPLSLYHSEVRPEWIDYNGHMTEAANAPVVPWISK